MIPSASATTTREPVPSLRSISFACPVCRIEMGRLDDSPSHYVYCRRCSFVLREQKGILRAQRPGREAHFRQFGQGLDLCQFLHRASLPRPDRQLSPIEARHPQGLDVLDIGAGNCWQSYQLAKRGHRLVAVDLLDNDTDGLGAARHYSAHLRNQFLCVQAEMDHLPFAAAQFDIVFFNASFHYSVDYEQTIAEALRCLRRPGHLIISDSPFYRSELSGQKMIQEKHAAFRKRHAFRSDSIPSLEYLTRPRLDHLADKFGLQWKTLRPWCGINWVMRPVKAFVLRKREPSNFFLFLAQVQPPESCEIRDHREPSKIGSKST
jgi:ubiquinone/menaquinone biosynthesis C-methylase UbiE